MECIVDNMCSTSVKSFHLLWDLIRYMAQYNLTCNSKIRTRGNKQIRGQNAVLKAYDISYMSQQFRGINLGIFREKFNPLTALK